MQHKDIRTKRHEMACYPKQGQKDSCSPSIHVLHLFYFSFFLKTPDHIQLHQNIGNIHAYFFALLFNQIITNNMLTAEFQNNDFNVLIILYYIML